MDMCAAERATTTEVQSKLVGTLAKAAADVRDCARLNLAQIHDAYVATMNTNGERVMLALDNWAAESLVDVSVDYP